MKSEEYVKGVIDTLSWVAKEVQEGEYPAVGIDSLVDLIKKITDDKKKTEVKNDVK